MMNGIVVVGGGGHAKVVVGVLKKLHFEIVGYTDPQDRGTILGMPYLGNDDILAEFASRRSDCGAVLGLGKIDASPTRRRLQAEVEALGFEFPVIVSPHAVVNEEVALGPGTVVFDGAVINSGATTGRSCIINTNSTVEHDCRLGENVHIASGSIVSGGVSIGADCMIGAGSTIVQDVTMCPDCLIGAGSTVIRDIAAPGIYAGNPARRIG